MSLWDACSFCRREPRRVFDGDTLSTGLCEACGALYLGGMLMKVRRPGTKAYVEVPSGALVVLPGASWEEA